MIAIDSEKKKVIILEPAYTPGQLSFQVEVPASVLPHSRSRTSFGEAIPTEQKVAKAIETSLADRFQGTVKVEGITNYDNQPSKTAKFLVTMSGPGEEMRRTGGGDSDGLFLRYLTTLFEPSPEERHQMKMTDLHRGSYRQVVENIDPTFMDAEYTRDTGIPNSLVKLEAILQRDIKTALGQETGRAA